MASPQDNDEDKHNFIEPSNPNPAARFSNMAFTACADTLQRRGTTTFAKVAMTLSFTIIVTVAVFLLVGSGYNNNDATEHEIPMLGFSGVASCTFDECFSTNCNPEVAPFTCLFHNGGPHGGCSTLPWIIGTCDKQCDLSTCKSIEIPTDTDSCESVACDKHWCHQGQLCGPLVPYQCTEGASTFGCSADPLQWTLRTSDTTCAACCDVSTCGE